MANKHPNQSRAVMASKGNVTLYASKTLSGTDTYIVKHNGIDVLITYKEQEAIRKYNKLVLGQTI